MWLEFEQLSHQCLRGYGGEAFGPARLGRLDGWLGGNDMLFNNVVGNTNTNTLKHRCAHSHMSFFLFWWPVKQLQMNSLFLIFFSLKQLNSTAACLSYLLLSIDSVMMVFGCFFCFFLTVAHFRII